MKGYLSIALAAASCLSMLAALFMVFVYVPTEVEQGIVQRIFYFHLPCAWVAFLAFGMVAIAGVLYLWLGHKIWDELGYACAELGMLFCTLVLITGSIWAKPIWGVWWTWDSRLTTTFILWLLYGGYLLLRAFADDSDEIARFAAVLGIVGVARRPGDHHLGQVVAYDPSRGAADPSGRTWTGGSADGRHAAGVAGRLHHHVHLAALVAAVDFAA